MAPFWSLEDMERMESIDLKAITAEVVTELSNMSLKRRTGGWHRSQVTTIQVSPDTVRSSLLFGVWEKCFGVLNEHVKGKEPLAAEKALTIMTRKGLPKDNIQFRKNSFRVQLENAQYRIYKMSETSIYACPWPSERRCGILVSGETLADFMIRFDEEIPDIVSHVTTIMAVIRARELEETKRVMEVEIKDNLVQTLIDQYLKPLGLSVLYNIGAGDIVSMDLRKVMSAHIEVPLGELAGKLKDTASVVDALSVEAPEIEPDYEYIDELSGLIP